MAKITVENDNNKLTHLLVVCFPAWVLPVNACGHIAIERMCPAKQGLWPNTRNKYMEVVVISLVTLHMITTEE